MVRGPQQIAMESSGADGSVMTQSTEQLERASAAGYHYLDPYGSCYRYRYGVRFSGAAFAGYYRLRPW